MAKSYSRTSKLSAAATGTQTVKTNRKNGESETRQQVLYTNPRVSVSLTTVISEIPNGWYPIALKGSLYAPTPQRKRK
jgi:hypothetical protein